MATKTKTDMIDVLSLQDIIYDRIFPLLDMRDIFRLRGASRAYRKMVTEYFQGQKHLVIDEVTLLQYKPKKDCLRPINVMAANTGKVTRLEIRMEPSDKSNKKRGPQWLSISDHNKKVDAKQEEKKRKLDKYWLQPKDIYKLLEANPCLETLVLTNLGPRVIDGQLLVNLQRDCPNLKRLELRGCFGWPQSLNLLDLEGKTFPRITHFVVENTVISDGCLCVLLSKMTALDELELANLKLATDRVAFTLAEWTHNLRYLSIQCCYDITDTGLQVAFEYLSNLKKISISPEPVAKSAATVSRGRGRGRGVRGRGATAGGSSGDVDAGKRPYTQKILDVITSHGVEVEVGPGNPEVEIPGGYTSDSSDD